jgi:beta-aspartyl-peptidase (threonine type)
MSDAGRPPLVRLTWRIVLAIALVDVVLTTAVVLAIVSVARGAPVAATPEAAAVRAVLDSQVAAWNRGDLDGFMAGYWNDEKLTFFSGDTITHGWKATLDRYRKRYQADGRDMGQLVFRGVDVENLGTNAAFVRGRWRLTMKDGKMPNGLFTLIVRRIDGHWRIVHDHTSAAEPK